MPYASMRWLRPLGWIGACALVSCTTSEQDGSGGASPEPVEEVTCAEMCAVVEPKLVGEQTCTYRCETLLGDICVPQAQDYLRCIIEHPTIDDAKAGVCQQPEYAAWLACSGSIACLGYSMGVSTGLDSVHHDVCYGVRYNVTSSSHDPTKDPT